MTASTITFNRKVFQVATLINPPNIPGITRWIGPFSLEKMILKLDDYSEEDFTLEPITDGLEYVYTTQGLGFSNFDFSYPKFEQEKGPLVRLKDGWYLGVGSAPLHIVVLLLRQFPELRSHVEVQRVECVRALHEDHIQRLQAELENMCETAIDAAIVCYAGVATSSWYGVLPISTFETIGANQGEWYPSIAYPYNRLCASMGSKGVNFFLEEGYVEDAVDIQIGQVGQLIVELKEWYQLKLAAGFLEVA